jgi:hypothetical protein
MEKTHVILTMMQLTDGCALRWVFPSLHCSDLHTYVLRRSTSPVTLFVVPRRMYVWRWSADTVRSL